MLNESFIYEIPKELISNIQWLIYVLQAVGGFIIFFILFSVIKSIIDNKKRKELKKITFLLEEIKTILKSNKS